MKDIRIKSVLATYLLFIGFLFLTPFMLGCVQAVLSLENPSETAMPSTVLSYTEFVEDMILTEPVGFEELIMTVPPFVVVVPPDETPSPLPEPISESPTPTVTKVVSTDTPKPTAKKSDSDISEKPKWASNGRLLTPEGKTGIVRGRCSDAEWNRAVKYWEHIPKGWRDKFKFDGWTMYVTNDDFWTYADCNSLAGLTDVPYRTIYVRGSSNRTAVIVAHEFAHYVDKVCGFPSLGDEFKALYKREKGTFRVYKSVGDGHCTSDSVEFFAAVFNQILEDPSSEVTAPESFEFVRKYLNMY